MCRRVLWLAVLLTASFSFFGQSHFGVKADAGVSKLAFGEEIFFLPPDSKKSNFQFSYRAGITYSYRFKGFSAIGIDLLYSNIQGKQIGMGTSGTQTFTVTTNQNLFYFALPLYYTAHIKRFSASLGGCLMIYEGGSSGEKIIQIFNHTSSEYISKSYNPGISHYDFGLTGGLSYKLLKHLVVSLNGYYSFTPIYYGNGQVFAMGWSGRIMQFTGGLTYYAYISKSRSGPKATSVRDMD